jgi:hypothetical protein
VSGQAQSAEAPRRGVSSQRAEEPRCFSIIPSRSSDQSVLTRTGSSYAPDDWWLIESDEELSDPSS